MGYNTKNYTEQGGEKTVIGGEIVIKNGGKLVIEEGGSTEGLPSPEPQVLPKAENQADSEATSVAVLKTDFNALLAKLKAAGLMEEDPETPAENPVETPTENN